LDTNINEFKKQVGKETTIEDAISLLITTDLIENNV
jgi:hypothetical protein